MKARSNDWGIDLLQLHLLDKDELLCVKQSPDNVVIPFIAIRFDFSEQVFSSGSDGLRVSIAM